MTHNKSHHLTSHIFLLTSILLIGCSGGDKRAGGFSFPPMPVEVANVQRQNVTDRFEAVGTIEALEAITVVSEVDGTVKSLPFIEGGTLERGALIAQMDDTQLAADVARAEALRDQSQASYDRVKAIVDQNAGSAQDLDDAASALKVAEANLALARARIAKTRIVAPFNGVVGARRISPGAFLRAGQAITELANIDDIRVIFSAPERYISKLKPGAEVTVSTTAHPGYEVKGKILVIDPVLDPGTRTARIVARMSNPGRTLHPGMSASVAAVLSERTNALTIPNEAVFATGDQSFVFVVKPDSTVARVPLTLGTRMSDIVEVVQGLEPGMQVVRAGHQKLFDGARVIPMMPQGAQGSK